MSDPTPTPRTSEQLLAAPRTLVMGIVNVTPDSFSDGGDFADPQLAIAHGRELMANGADLIDVGGESTRPGAQRASLEEELHRVLPVVQALTADGIPVSVDTMRAQVAVATAKAGAVFINDVSGGLADPDMLPAVAELGLPYIAMHWRAHSTVMQDRDHTTYEQVVPEVVGELEARVEAAVASGIERSKIVLDPGIGFSKTGDQNWEILQNLDAFARLGFPLLIGVSRKRFLGDLLADADGQRPPKQRDDASAAITALLAERGVWAVRTHSVRQHRDAITVAERWNQR